MNYHSTRNEKDNISAARAIATGLASDGGLFVPECLPKVSMEEINELRTMDYRARAVRIMGKFLPEFTTEELEFFASRAYSTNFDHEDIAPLHFTDDATAYLELWHGPTCAFKDMALQMLPYLLTYSLKKTGEERKVCILVATSGDTGKAALEGFKDVEDTRIFVFYPKDGVSDIQKLQMITQAGQNVGVCSVEGNFDDAQTGVKKIFSDREFAEKLSQRGWFLSSANSINWGRLLPQIVYYFSAYCDYVNAGKLNMGDELLFCVPTGNFGNILAGWYAKNMGLPAGGFICASNENNVLTDFINTGVYDKNRPFHTTISPSMDILVSSNLERLMYTLTDAETVSSYMAQLNTAGRYEVGADVLEKVKSGFCAGCCDDADTKATIRRVFGESHYLIDTHTAVAAKVLEDYRAQSGDKRPAVIVSTASPFKFAADVADALGVDCGNDPLKALSDATGRTVPAPLSGLDERVKRFNGVTAKEEMILRVDEFIK